MLWYDLLSCRCGWLAVTTQPFLLGPYARPCACPPRQLAYPPATPTPCAVRNPALLWLHSLIAALMGLITGLVFLDSDFTNVGECLHMFASY